MDFADGRLYFSVKSLIKPDNINIGYTVIWPEALLLRQKPKLRWKLLCRLAHHCIWTAYNVRIITQCIEAIYRQGIFECLQLVNV